MSEYGYVRVSTKEQNEDRQLLAMWEIPLTKKQIFVDSAQSNPSARKN